MFIFFFFFITIIIRFLFFFFFSSRRRHTRLTCDWSSDVCSSDLGGITYMVDVAAMPDNAFGYVPTPAIVAPIEFTMRLVDYRDLGGHMGSVRPVESIIEQLQLTGQLIGNG